MHKIQILLIEQNRLLREHMSAIVRKQADITLVAVGGTLENIALKSAKLRPDIALIDLHPSQRKTLDVLNRVHEMFASAKLILTGCIPADGRGGG